MRSPLIIGAAALHKAYRTHGGEVHAVAGVDLDVRSGELLAIVGPSGSGKSTLMNLLGLLDRPDHGRYTFDGVDAAHLTPDRAAFLRNQRIGFVFQNFNLLPRRTAVENVELPLTYAGIGPRERRERAIRGLHEMGLGHRLHHWPHQLSGGEQQRVAIARALIADPALILADEPTGAIDTATGREILELLLALNRGGKAVLIVTHDPNVARRMPRVISMRDGRVVSDRRGSASLPGSAIHGSTNVPLPPDTRRGPHGFVSAAASLASAVRALRANALRSALTTLGIIIGVGAVIAMVGIGSGANLRVAEQIRSLGTNLLLIQPGSASTGALQLGAGTGISLTEADANAITHEVPGVQVAAPGLAGTAQLVHGNRNWATTIGGVTPEYLVARDWRVEHGRPFSSHEVAAAEKVVLLGTTTAERLFEGDDPIGRLVRIGNVPFTVVGILGRKGQSSASGRDQDDVALLPLSTAKMRLFGRYSQLDRLAVDYVLVKVSPERSMDVVSGEITALLRQRHRIAAQAENDFVISDPTEAIQAQAAATRTLGVLLATVSSVALLVGGISIMNIMLVSVTERTREIGLRLAVGARRRDIRVQFLIEAAVLCLLGGTIGLLLGVAAAWSAAARFGWAAFLGPSSFLFALGSAAAIGLFFGSYPAAKAARLDPIEALRSE
jgi:macrolide transport system ATP-binding/permease protein